MKSDFHYKYYMLGLLTIIGVFNYLDRYVLSLAMESLKLEFELSDSQLGLVNGFAFALFYAVAGIPIARWADRGNRSHVIALSTMLWSVMITIAGMVGNFYQLLLVRVGVAVGESGCIPPSQSLISDYFNRTERPRAMAIYWVSPYLSACLAFIGGGWLLEQVGWRVTFFIIGISGVSLALLAKLTLREPRLVRDQNSDESKGAIPPAKQMSLQQVLNTLWQRRTFRHLVMAFSLSYFCVSGIGAWIPTFFIRSHGMGASELGVWLGLALGIGGMVFTLLGGFLSAHYAPRQERLQMHSIALIFALCAVFHALCYLSANKYLALALQCIVLGVLISLTFSPIYSAIQSLVEERSRAVALAFILMLANLIGVGIGPVAVGMLSDVLEPAFGQESLRYALLFFSPGYLWCAYHFWKTAKTIEDDIRCVEEKSSSLEEKKSPENNVPYQTVLSE